MHTSIKFCLYTCNHAILNTCTVSSSATSLGSTGSPLIHPCPHHLHFHHLYIARKDELKNMKLDWIGADSMLWVMNEG